MLDVLITGGDVIDGTGAVRRRADVGIVDGRITQVGTITESAHQTIDATGKVVTPGFIDLHTHYDAQAFWDTSLSPSPLHGVTTVIGGNCGFTIAPLTPQDGDYLMRMLARVEGMPLESLQQGLPWDWSTTAEYLDALDGTLMPNAGFLVGHSALRRVVMHDAANQREATDEEIEAMCNLLRDGLRAGGMGFSSTWSPSHNDHTGVPVPSRHGSRKELIALCAVVEEFPGTTLEFIPAVGEFAQETFELMGDMSAAANRPLNWNLLQVYAQNW
ncbi:MAG: amidohydrolase family protein, partial [Actinomycetes bacterium]